MPDLSGMVSSSFLFRHLDFLYLIDASLHLFSLNLIQMPESPSTPQVTVTLSESPYDADVAIASVGSSGEPGTLNLVVLKAYGYSSAA